MRAFSARGSIISSNDGGTRSVNLDISGRDLAEIYRVGAARLRPRARPCSTIPRIGSSPSSLSLDQPLVELRPHWERAAELGWMRARLGFAVAALTDGAFVDEFFRDDDKIDILPVQPAPAANSSCRALERPADLRAGAGVVPLSARGRHRGDRRHRHHPPGQRPAHGDAEHHSAALRAAGDGVGEVRDARWSAACAARAQLPPEVSLDISGASDQLDATRDALARQLPRRGRAVLPAAGRDLPPLGLSAGHPDHGAAGHRRRHRRPCAAQRLGALLPAIGLAAVHSPST